mmetsp:Transcript_30156/g.70363  ORF Transcript_30156/g.70363 Transcript_30156/m.70363 type:complete len:211 (-) Transcript_30156:2327-2959(-)
MSLVQPHHSRNHPTATLRLACFPLTRGSCRHRQLSRGQCLSPTGVGTPKYLHSGSHHCDGPPRQCWPCQWMQVLLPLGCRSSPPPAISVPPSQVRPEDAPHQGIFSQLGRAPIRPSLSSHRPGSPMTSLDASRRSGNSANDHAHVAALVLPMSPVAVPPHWRLDQVPIPAHTSRCCWSQVARERTLADQVSVCSHLDLNSCVSSHWQVCT